MSLRSSRSSHVSLLRNSVAGRSSFVSSQTKIRRDLVKTALEEFVRDKNARPYEELLRTLHGRNPDEREILLVLDECSLCAGIMGRETGLLVEILFALDWHAMSDEVIRSFSKWTLDLLTAQIYHTSAAVGSLTKSLAKSDSPWSGNPSEAQSIIYSHLHSLIAQIVSVIPMSTEVLIASAVNHFPYYKSAPETNQAYVHNLLWITRYLPALQNEFLTLILNKLIVLDVSIKNNYEAPNADTIFNIETEDKMEDLIESLDLCMAEVFQWIDHGGTEVFDALLPVFQKVILPTHGTKNVQFLVLYGLSKDYRRVGNFLEMLWQLIPSARVGPSLRQASVVHLTGLLARATFVDMFYVKTFLQKMAEWCNFYIKAQETPSSNNGKNPHSVFYSVCQCLFYLVAFKHKELFTDKKDVIFVGSLNLSKIIMCSLNPLRVCHEGVAEAFASITRIHQIVYCHTIMEQNARRHLRIDNEEISHQEWFPYDPYSLPKSFKWIQPVYREYEETVTDDRIDDGIVETCEEDDFLATSPNVFLSKSSFNSLRHLN